MSSLKPRLKQPYGEVKVVSANLSYQWDIIQNTCDFYNKKCGESLASPIFHANESQWRMNLYPNGSQKESEGCLDVFLKSENAFKMKLNCKFLVKNDQNVVIVQTSFVNCPFEPGYSKGHINIIHNKLLPIKFSILCEITIDEESYNEAQRSRLQTSISELESLVEVCELDGLENLLNNEKHSDFKFTIDGKELYVHKNILAIRSKHFERMFEHESRNEDKIEDIEYDVFYELMRFLYTGKISELEKYAEDLLVAANKYNLQKLKIVCENKIIKKLTTDNVIDTIIFADTYDAQELKKEAITFFVLHGQDMKEMSEFKSSLKSLTEDLYYEVICSFIENLK